MSFAARGRVTPAAREAAIQITRRILEEPTREDADPQPDMNLVNVQDEFTTSNIEWRDAYYDLKTSLKQLEEKYKKLNLVLQQEIDSIISSLMMEMVNTVVFEENYKRLNLVLQQETEGVISLLMAEMVNTVVVEENFKKFELFMKREVDGVISLLMVEMVNAVVLEDDRRRKNNMDHFEGPIMKKPRLF